MRFVFRKLQRPSCLTSRTISGNLQESAPLSFTGTVRLLLVYNDQLVIDEPCHLPTDFIFVSLIKQTRKRLEHDLNNHDVWSLRANI